MPRARRKPAFPAKFPDSRAKTTTSSVQPNTNLEIPIYDVPRYDPAQVPPQPPISLLLPRDTDAYILGTVVSPFDVPPEREATVRRVLNYIVGWPDEPYARELVPCTKVLDYVSPRELEDWEYAKTKREHAAREQLLKLGRDGVEAGANEADANEATDEDTDLVSEKVYETSRRDRRLRETPATEPLLRTGTEGVGTHGSGPRVPVRQRHRRKPRISKHADGTAAVGSDLPPANSPSAKRVAQSLAPLAAGGQRTGLPLTQLVLETGTAAETSSDELGDTNKATTMRILNRGLLRGAVVDDWPDNGSETKPEAGPVTPDAPDDMADEDEEDDSKHAAQSGWPIPLPKRHRDSTVSTQSRKRPKIQYQIPQTITPILPPNIPSETSLPRRKQEHKHSRSTSIQLVLPVAKVELPSPKTAPQETEIPVAVTEDDDLYEIDYLEDDIFTTVDDIDGSAESGSGPSKGQGRTVRFFLVRWKGDWPPDQNPSWEPAESLPPGIVRRYLKQASRNRAAKEAVGSPSHSRIEASSRTP